jgi:hypothetical protein
MQETESTPREKTHEEVYGGYDQGRVERPKAGGMAGALPEVRRGGRLGSRLLGTRAAAKIANVISQ